MITGSERVNITILVVVVGIVLGVTREVGHIVGVFVTAAAEV